MSRKEGVSTFFLEELHHLLGVPQLLVAHATTAILPLTTARNTEGVHMAEDEVADPDVLSDPAHLLGLETHGAVGAYESKAHALIGESEALGRVHLPHGR